MSSEHRPEFDNVDGEMGPMGDLAPYRPSRYRVLMFHNDHAPLEFIADVLRSFFHMSVEAASRVMRDMRHEGVGVCGVYFYEIAESKATQVITHAQTRGWTLDMSLERD